LDEVVTAALHQLSITYWRDDQHDLIVIPFHGLADHAEPLHVFIEGRDVPATVTLTAELLTVAMARRASVALLLAEINSQAPFVVFSMTESGAVYADISVDLDGAGNPQALIARAIGRLLTWIQESFTAIRRVSRQSRRQRPTRMEREVAEILRRSEPS
jgi:hypothetical protein